MQKQSKAKQNKLVAELENWIENNFPTNTKYDAGPQLPNSVID